MALPALTTQAANTSRLQKLPTFSLTQSIISLKRSNERTSFPPTIVGTRFGAARVRYRWAESKFCLRLSLTTETRIDRREHPAFRQQVGLHVEELVLLVNH